MSHQPAILAAVPPSARFLAFGMRPGADAGDLLARLGKVRPDDAMVVGVGEPLVLAAGRALPRIRSFPAITGVGAAYPSTQGAIWALVSGGDAGETLLRARALAEALGDGVLVEEEVLAFKYAEGRDLSGYEDGTENPKEDAAIVAAIVSGAGAGLDGSSFVAAQRWVHELARIEHLDAAARDALIGRRRDTNEEMADAPASAHVKRAAQESFDPPAFMVRRSMPWGTTQEHGLYFVAYGASLDPFERVLRRMAGLEDGVADGLSRFTRAVSGGYYWCPPLVDGRLDLRALATRAA